MKTEQQYKEVRTALFVALIGYVFLFVLIVKEPAGHAQQPKDQASAKPIATPTPDPLELTQAELADAGAIINEFESNQKKLGAANDALYDAYDKGAAAFDAAAKDVYIIVGKIKQTQAKYRAWEGPVKERIKCPDCSFNTQTGKMVRPQPAPKQ